MIFMMAFLFFGSFLLGLAFIVLFWAISILVYLFAWFMSLFGVFVDISGNRNLQVIFLVICAITYYVYDVSNLGFALFVFLSAGWMLLKSADIWRISSC